MKPLLSISVIFLFCATASGQITQQQPGENGKNEQEVLTVVEQMPVFPGGDKEMIEFIRTNVKYPFEAIKQNISGTVYVTFVVDTSGELNRIRILRGVSPELDSEAVRVVASMPTWIPGKQKGKAVAVQFNLPIKFKLMVPETMLNDTMPSVEKSKQAFQTGVLYFDNDDFLSAVSFFSEALIFPTEFEMDALLLRGCAYYNLNDSAKACNDWKTGYQLFDVRAAHKLEEYCGCFYNRRNKVVYFENAKEERLKYDSLNLVYDIVEVMPQFPGGEVELTRFLQKNIHYPAESLSKYIQGTVFLTFVIDTEGQVSDITLLRGVSQELDEEAIRVLKKMPKWIPGTHNGVPVPVHFNLPIYFSINKSVLKLLLQYDQNKNEDFKTAYTIVDTMPQFPGGASELVRYLQKNIVYPAEAFRKNIRGTVFLTFVVGTYGRIHNIEILRGVDPDLDSEAIRVVQSMPKWIPGKKNGVPVPVQFNLPIRFSM